MGFTNIRNGLDVQKVSFVNEFRRAWSERRQTISQSAVADIQAGEDIQAVSFWKDMQDWLESNCTGFVNHAATIAGATGIPMHTLSTWRAAAGLDDGFRRKSSIGASFSRGKMQAGDIIGSWIFEDLQAGFDALRWTIRGSFGAASDVEEKVSHAFGDDYEEALADAEANWPASWSSDEDGVFFYYASMQATGGHAILLSRIRSDAEFIDIPTHVAHSADGYYLLNRQTYTYYDPDGLGAIEDTLWKVQSFASASVNQRTVDKLSYSTAPSIGAPSGTGDVRYAITAAPGVYLVLKWDFTHTL